MLHRVAGSFRDPSGFVFRLGSRVLRVVAPAGAENFVACKDILREFADAGRLVDFKELDPANLNFEDGIVAAHVLEHPLIAPQTMPYEWSFSQLKDAAIFHLDLHLDLLERGYTLSDASAYNVQFQGAQPIFIDHLSIRKYREGEFWLGHRQFCEQFLNPLLLRAYCDVAHNSWYRGNLEGIPQGDFAKLLPRRRKFSWNVLSHVVLPAHFQKSTTSDREVSFSVKHRKLPLAGFKGMLQQLRRWIVKLKPANVSATTWADYAHTNTYSGPEAEQKRRLVGEFVRRAAPKSVVDLGCNTGDFSKVCLEAGAEKVIGFDFDQQALDRAHSRAKAEGLDFLALYLDARNPSPSQGWRERERAGFSERIKADAVIALAFEHHLAIAHNVPLDQVVEWIVDVAPAGIIEFVPKDDPTIVKMLALREDIFTGYTKDAFEQALSRVARIVSSDQVSSSGRVLYSFERA